MTAEIGVWVDVLGPLRLRTGGSEVSVPGRRPSTVLACLALSAGRTVSLETLVDHVWGEQLPLSAGASLHNVVARLRRVVGPDVIRTVPAGYVLDVEPEHVDLLRFRRLVDDARRARDLVKERLLLAEALELWRGEPLPGLPSDTLRRAVVPALVEEYLAVLERRIALDLEAGAHGELIGELRELVGRYPLRETLWHHLITAQDHAGRRADALDSYRRLRTEMRERLGVEPNADLQNSYQRLLVDPAAGPGQSQGRGQGQGQGSASGPSPVPASVRARTSMAAGAARLGSGSGRSELPGDTADFTGRTRELDRLLAPLSDGGDAVRTVMISAIDGMAGIGKTTFAVHLAHRLAAYHPDGQLFVDLHGHTPGRDPLDPADALDHLLRSIGVPAEHIPDDLAQRAGLWRAELAGRRVLVVLDNAATASQVLPLLPGTAGCLAVVTSRRRMADLDGARVLSLDVMPATDALTLFASIVGPDRAAAEPEAVEQVLDLCGHLPLAIRIAGGRLRARPAWSVGHLAERLADEGRRLAELASGERSVAAAFALSYGHLAPAHRRLFRLLGLHPGPLVDAHVAAAMAELDVHDAEEMLEDLVDAHLLRQPVEDGYQFHDLVRQYARAAAERDESARDREAAVDRMLDFYVCVTDLARSHFVASGGPVADPATTAPSRLPPIEDTWQALAWCDSQRPNLAAVVTYAADRRRDEHLCRLSRNTWWFFRLRGYLPHCIALQHSAVEAAERLGDQHTEADMHRILGIGYGDSQHYDDAIHHYSKALVLYRATGDLVGQRIAQSNLGGVHWELGRYEQAAEFLRRALDCSREAGGTIGDEATILTNLALTCWSTGRYPEALDHGRRALTGYRQTGDLRGEGYALSALGLAHGSLRDDDEALRCHDQAVQLMRSFGDRAGESEILNDLGRTLRTLERPDQARDRHEQALELARQTNVRVQQARAHDGIAETLQDADPDAAREHWRQALEIYAELGRPEADRVRALLNVDIHVL